MTAPRRFQLALLALCFIFGAVFAYTRFVTSTSITQAQIATSRIGTHLGEASIEFQSSILDFILPKILADNNSSPADFPVTLSVQIDTSSSDIERLATITKKHGYFPIIRVYRACDNINPVPVITSIRNHFGADTIISFGNELNLFPHECPGKNWQQFVFNYNQVRNFGPITPGPIAFYLKADQADAVTDETLLAQPGIRALYDGAPIRTANAYGCAYATSQDQCIAAETRTQLEALEGIGGRDTYITEFGLAPTVKDENAPDNDLSKVVEFIQYEAANNLTGAKRITPLIRNVCKGEAGTADWLLYVHGKVYTNLGDPVDLDCASSEDGDSIRGKAKTILSVEGGGAKLHEAVTLSGDEAIDQITRALAYGGFEAQAATIPYSLAQNLSGAVDDWKSQHPNQVLPISGVSTTQVIDMTNSEPGLLQLFGGTGDVNESVTAYWSAAPKGESSQFDDINAAAYYKQLNRHQLCAGAVELLRVELRNCDQLKGEKCDLLNQRVKFSYSGQEQSVSHKDIIRDLGLSQDGSGGPNITCNMLTLSEKKFREKFPDWGQDKISSQKFEQLQMAIYHMEHAPYAAYDLAFLVSTMEIQANNLFDLNFNNPLTPQETLANLWRLVQQKDPAPEAVSIVMFTIPAFGGNKSEGATYYMDPHDKVRQAQTSHRINEILEDERRKKREEIYADATRYHSISFTSAERKINCVGKICSDSFVDQIFGERDPLARALIDLAETAPDPIETPIDTPQIIKDKGTLPADEKMTYKNEVSFGGNFFSALFGNQAKPQVAEVQTKSTAYVTGDQAAPLREKDSSEAHVYLITRSGGITDQQAGRIMATQYSHALLERLEELTALRNQTGDEELIPAEDRHLVGNERVSLGGVITIDETAAEVPIADSAGCTVDPETDKKVCPTIKATVGGTVDQLSISNNQTPFRLTKLQAMANYRYQSKGYDRAQAEDTESFLLGLVRKKADGSDLPTQTDALEPVMLQTCTNRRDAQKPSGGRYSSITPGSNAVHICADTGEKCTSSAFNKKGELIKPTLYVESLHNIPNWRNPDDPHIDCKMLVQFACSFRKHLLANRVVLDNNDPKDGLYDVNGNVTACEYVVQRAKELRISPRFALAMWGEESGFHQYPVAGMGYDPWVNDMSLHYQIAGDRIFGDPSGTRTRGGLAGNVYGASNYLEFLRRYSGETGTTFINNKGFPARLKAFYDDLGPRSSFDYYQEGT